MDYLTNDTELTAVADAIREKCETTDSLEWPDGFIQAIEDCQTGGPELEWLWGNQITNTLSGTIGTASDAYAAPPMALTVEGASTQATTTGKNLWDDSRYTSVGWSKYDGSYLYHGYIARFCDNITDLGNGSYPENTQVTICLDIVRIGSSGTIKLRFDYTDGTSSTTSNIEATSYHKTFTSTAGKTVSAARMTTTAGSSNANFFFGNIQVGVGVSPSNYEPYSGGSPSPSPDYPQEIESVDALAFNSCGKNLIDPSTIEQGSLNAGVDFPNAVRCRTSGRIPAITGGSIVLSGTSSTGTLQYLLHCFKGGIFEASTSPYVNAGQPISLPSGVDECRIIFRNSDDSNITPSDLSNIQLELGSTATAYQPYTGSTTSLLSAGTELRSLPNGTRDQLNLSYLRPSTREGWAWYSRELVQRCGILADVGAATIVEYRSSTAENIVYYIRDFESGTEPSTPESYTHAAMCPMLKDMPSRPLASARNSTYTNGVMLAPASSAPAIYMNVMVAEYPTKDDFKTSFAGVHIVYEIATPITHDLGTIELPQLPAPTTTVWCDGGSAQPTFTLEYIQNANIVISRLESEIADLATS